MMLSMRNKIIRSLNRFRPIKVLKGQLKLKMKKSRWRDSNPRPADYESAAIPLSHSGNCLKRLYLQNLYGITCRGSAGPAPFRSTPGW